MDLTNQFVITEYDTISPIQIKNLSHGAGLVSPTGGWRSIYSNGGKLCPMGPCQKYHHNIEVNITQHESLI